MVSKIVLRLHHMYVPETGREDQHVDLPSRNAPCVVQQMQH